MMLATMTMEKEKHHELNTSKANDYNEGMRFLSSSRAYDAGIVRSAANYNMLRGYVFGNAGVSPSASRTRSGAQRGV
eukprot:422727-Prymnesium_polylepis.1